MPESTDKEQKQVLVSYWLSHPGLDQDLVLTPGQLDGTIIPLKYVKYQNVQNVQFFVKVS